MALSVEEKKIIEWGKSNGKPQIEIEKAVVKFRASQVKAAPEELKKGFIERTKESAAQGLNKVKSAFQESKDGRNPISTGAKLGAGVIETVTSPITAALQPVIEPTIGKGVNYAVDKYSDYLVKNNLQDTPEANFVGRVAEDVGNINTIAGTVFGSKAAANLATNSANIVARRASGLVDDVIDTTPQAVSKIREIIEPPKPSPLEAVGQVLQGKSDDIKAGISAIKDVDVAGVKTFSQLYGKIKETIGTFSKKVDDELDQDKGFYKLKDLMLSGKTKQGQIVKVDYVGRALDHLKELYKSVGDDIELKNIGDLITIAKKQGLTRKQVNDIARVYGEEFGEKAFGKTGDPLTSINAVKFEKTRSGLKSVARGGLKGSKAQKLDKSISNLYRVEKLVKQNVEAVNKLTQKIQERGLLEKAGYQASKILDILTGGSLRGIMGGLLPRGAGYKVMNALDLEKVLERNLKVIKEALESGNDAELLKILKGIK